MPESDRLVAVAAYGLAGSRTDLPAGPLSEVEWFDLVQGCLAADLVGFLAAAVTAGDMAVTSAQAEELAVLDSECVGLSLLVERRALAAAALVGAAGIDHRVVDGPARRLAYGDAGTRHHRAVRLLVSSRRLGDALALQGPAPTPVAGQAAHRRERLAVLSSVPGLGGVDGQPRSPAAQGEVAVAVEADLLARLGPAAVIDLAGRSVPVLTLEQQLLVACAEMAADPVTPLVQLRDVAELALCPDLDSAGARHLAESTRSAEALADGVSLAWERFDLADQTGLSVWARRMSGSRRPGPGVRAAPRSSAPVGRVGFAQRVFGRGQTGEVPAGGLPLVPLTTTAAAPSGVPRPNRSARRQT
jgi:hypothetical protein